MSLIDVAKSIANIPGTLIREVGDAILPKQLHWAVDAAAMAVDLEAGNYTGVAGDALSLLDDVQDAGLGLDGLKSQLPPELIDTLEKLAQPDPPAEADVQAETAPDEADGTDIDASGPDASDGPASASSAAGSAPKSAEAAKPKTAKPKTTKPKSTAKPKSASTPKSAAKPKSASTTKAGSTPKTADIAKLSDDDLMKMVADGTIPADVMKDDKAMMALQMRVQQIQEMNTLLTNMLRDLHDMKMDIIRNTRA